MTLIVTLLVGLSVAAAPRCEDVVADRAHLAARALEGDTQKITEAWRNVAIRYEGAYRHTERFRFDGELAIRLNPRSGFMNDGIYLLDGSKRILKLYHEYTFNRAEFSNSVRGNLMAMLVGGPMVFRYGELRSADPIETSNKMGDERPPGAGSKVFFIEFENIAPVGSITVKDALATGKRLPVAALKKMAELALRALQLRIVPEDADFMVMADGSVRWIDGDLWLREENRSLADLAKFYRSSLAILPTGFAEVFKEALKSSPLFTPQQKEQIQNAWQK